MTLLQTQLEHANDTRLEELQKARKAFAVEKAVLLQQKEEERAKLQRRVDEEVEYLCREIRQISEGLEEERARGRFLTLELEAATRKQDEELRFARAEAVTSFLQSTAFLEEVKNMMVDFCSQDYDLAINKVLEQNSSLSINIESLSFVQEDRERELGEGPELTQVEEGVRGSWKRAFLLRRTSPGLGSLVRGTGGSRSS